MTLLSARTAIAPYIDIRGAKAPAISPDGEWLAFLGDRSGHDQIWMQPLAGGEAEPLARTPEPVGLIAFSPVGRDLVFASDRGGDERHQFFLLPEGAHEPVPLTDAPSTVHLWGGWSPDGKRIAYTANARDPFHLDVHVMDVATRSARRVMEGMGYREVMGFTADGQSLVIRDRSRGPHDQDLVLLEIETGQARLLLPRIGRTNHAAARIRKDGQGLFLVTDHGRDYLGLAYLSFGGDLEWMVALEGRDVETLAVSPDRSRIAYTVNEEGWSRIVLRDLATGAETSVEGLPPGTVSSLLWTPDGASLVFPLEGASTPSAIWRWTAENGRAEQLTQTLRTGIDETAFLEPVALRVTSFDGLDVPIFLYEPETPAPAGGRPAIVIVHGGPEAQWRPGFRADIQYMLSRGITVVAPNVRGSTGYGRRFEALDDRQRRMDAVADLIAVRRWLGERPDVDEKRVGVFGRSYGGFMVLAALTEEPDLWKLGISFYGIANFETLLETTGPWRKRLREAEYGSLEEDAEFLRRVSPIRKIGRVEAPLLLVHGLDDPRVPPAESEMAHSALRGLGKPVEILRIEHEGHGFGRVESRQAAFGAVADFLERHL